MITIHFAKEQDANSWRVFTAWLATSSHLSLAFMYNAEFRTLFETLHISFLSCGTTWEANQTILARYIWVNVAPSMSASSISPQPKGTGIVSSSFLRRSICLQLSWWNAGVNRRHDWKEPRLITHGEKVILNKPGRLLTTSILSVVPDSQNLHEGLQDSFTRKSGALRTSHLCRKKTDTASLPKY